MPVQTPRATARTYGRMLSGLGSGAPLVEAQKTFEVPLVGQASCEVELATPERQGRHRLVAKVFWDDPSPTVSHRTVVIEA